MEKSSRCRLGKMLRVEPQTLQFHNFVLLFLCNAFIISIPKIPVFSLNIQTDTYSYLRLYSDRQIFIFTFIFRQANTHIYIYIQTGKYSHLHLYSDRQILIFTFIFRQANTHIYIYIRTDKYSYLHLYSDRQIFIFTFSINIQIAQMNVACGV